ncbi:hypothetical protein LTR36_004193 [Oleoguttula mirabilis]|uniref:RRN7-type domain-containing protein n=1 Tax=Oleoguttula mirabilis TaxID=1507867 RepID=A0AAV9JIE5_9PEZI|nr:hypothetical protein LTR36_004193 [Oleoguttula mirabilis]
MSSSRNERPECDYDNCGSTRFEVGDDGYTYCHRGHRQSERGTVVAEDTGELVNAGRKSRRKDSDAESIASKASGFSGPRAFEHYLLCLQLVLRKQLRWLIEVQGLPEELESLVRDLWALRLQKLQSRVSYDSETETEGHSQLFSSQSEGETSASETSHRSRRRSRARTDGSPNMLEMLCLCYTGVLLLREPVTVADMYAWVSNGELLYYRAAKEVPLGMRERLPATYQDLLEPQQLRRPQKLHDRILGLLVTLSSEFGMALPPINHPLILYRWVRELALPIEIFAATQRLARVLDLDFAFKLNGKHGSKDAVLRYPEARMMALIVVTTKLLFPVDIVKRYPSSASDMSALALDWAPWAELQPQTFGHQPTPRPDYQKMMDFSQADALQAADDQLDRYMDWFEQNVASEDIREHGKAGKEADFRRTLFQLFPAGNDRAQSTTEPLTATAPDQAITDKLRESQGVLKSKRIIEHTTDAREVNRTGSFYQRYRSADDLEDPVKLLYERAAGLAGLSMESMVRAVFLIEGKMQRHEENSRKDGNDSSSSDAESA